MEGWTEFYLGEVGAAAAIAGLLFVAISINIESILAYPTLPGRAAQTLFIVSSALVVGSVGLFPGQPLAAFGWEAIATYLLLASTGVVQVAGLRRFRKSEGPIVWLIVPASVLLLVTIPGIVGGILLLNGDIAGAYWIAVDIILSLLGTLLGGWVMLVEILR
jgi:modulator of FtsH protease